MGLKPLNEAQITAQESVPEVRLEPATF